MIVSYDIDGVLAGQPPPNEKKWGRMNGTERKARKEFLIDWYTNAEKLIEPAETTFHAISARKREPRVYEATKNWLNIYYPERVISFHLLGVSRSVANVVVYKASKVLELGVARHYEDNKKVLRGMRKILPNEIELYFWEKGMGSPIPYLTEEDYESIRKANKNAAPVSGGTLSDFF
jgi:hypothetical protein